ncbi:hypothetical protein PUNSTDRAFT_24587, partial [Punctularia strigosozonata HHB-11173 SS5]
DISGYKLELTEELQKCHIYPQFHISKLHAYVSNDDTKFPGREPAAFYDFRQPVSTPDDFKYEAEEIVAHEWQRQSTLFLVRWTFGDSS